MIQHYPLDKIHLLICQHSENAEDDRVVDDFVAHHRTKFRRVSRIHCANRGFGAGHNTNFQNAETDLFFVSNVDLLFEKDALPILGYAALNAP